MSALHIKKDLSSDEVLKIFGDFDTVLTDCDGVLWIHNTKLQKASEVMNIFRNLGKRVFYVTNNSTKTREEFVTKCENLGFIAKEEEIVCTSQLVARYLKDLDFKKKVYVIGGEAIGKELEKVGIESYGWGPDSLTCLADIPEIKTNSDVGAVVVGFDEHISYPKMAKAATYLRDENIHFIATNTDENFPSETIICPGTGAIVRAIETCSGRKATILGKPEPYMCDVIRKDFQIDPKRTLMIGDRANTDILLGNRCGFSTLLVFTGVTSLEELKSWQEEEKKLKNSNEISEKENWLPQYCIDQLGDLLPFLEKCKLSESNN